MIVEIARAKVNLTLEVLGRRPDGYHELASLVGFANVGDEIALDVGQPVGVTVSGPFAPTLAGENLVVVALRRLAEADSRLQLGRVHLAKNLPVAAGIGGGSADAAAVLRAVSRANAAIAADVDWLGIAATLGADVPVCVGSATTWMTGIGEKLEAVNGWPRMRAVLVNPLASAPVDKTAQVFRRLAAKALDGGVAPPAPPATTVDPLVFMMARGNTLEAPAMAVMPVAANVKAALLATAHCRYAAVSGGGPTCFGVFDDAEAAAKAIKQRHPAWWVQAVVLG